MRTALVIVVPEVEPLIGRLRERYDAAGAMGAPSHVTLVFPFGDDEAGLEELFAAAPPFDFELVGTASFPDSTLYLEPEPAEPFVRLVEALAARYPDHPPYGGTHETIVPHVTVGQKCAGGRRPADRRRAPDPLPRGRCELARGGA